MALLLIIEIICWRRRGGLMERSGFEPWPGSLGCVLKPDTLLSQCPCTNQKSRKISPFFWLHKQHLRHCILRELEVGYFRPSPALLRRKNISNKLGITDNSSKSQRMISGSIEFHNSNNSKYDLCLRERFLAFILPDKATHKAERKAVRITFVLVYVIGLDTGHWQFGNNFIRDEKNLRTTKIGRDRRLSPICQSEDFFWIQLLQIGVGCSHITC